MTLDRTTGFSLMLAIVLHAGLAMLLGKMTLSSTPVAEVPLLIEVTLAGSSAPRLAEEGVKKAGDIVGAQKQTEETQEAAMTPQQIKTWRAERRRQIMRELAQTRKQVKIGTNQKELRKGNQDLAAGRGAGDWGNPGSPKGTLSLTGAIAARGYKEPDFSVLKDRITEETRLRLTLIVLPSGEVKKALLFETSGYPYIDQKAIELARKIVFDPLPSGWKQVDQQGVLTIKLKL